MSSRIVMPPILLMLAVAAASGPATPDAGVPTAASAPDDGFAVHVVIDTVGVDGRGTRTVATDEADLRPGAAGVLDKSVVLHARDESRRKETVRVKARIMPQTDTPEEAACRLRIDIEASASSAGKKTSGKSTRGGSSQGLETRSATLTLSPGEERLVEAFASVMTEGLVAFKIRCAPVRPAAGDESPFVTLNLLIEREAEGEPDELLRDQVLTATLGRQAGVISSANVPLGEASDEARLFRRERLEIDITPVVVVAGQLQLEIRVGGEVATVSESTPTVPHPIDRTETFLVNSGEPRQLVIEVLSQGTKEGWSRVRFKIQVTSRF